jgi:hypothetical protein
VENATALGLRMAAPSSEVGLIAPQARQCRVLFTSAPQRLQISLATTVPSVVLVLLLRMFAGRLRTRCARFLSMPAEAKVSLVVPQQGDSAKGRDS